MVAPEAPLGQSGPRGAQFENLPRARSALFDRREVSTSLLLVASHLDLLSLGFWLYACVISVSFCVLGFSRLFLAL